MLPVGMTHAFHNTADAAVEFAEMKARLPRGVGVRHAVPDGVTMAAGVHRIDVRDPRNRYFGHIDPESMDPALQTQDRLAVSVSMRTALIVYSGTTVKMMVDSDLGADVHERKPGTRAVARDAGTSGAGPALVRFARDWRYLEETLARESHDPLAPDGQGVRHG